MKYLLDTCVISDFIRNRTPVVERFSSVVPDDIAISVVTLMEIEYGLLLNSPLAKRIRSKLELFFKTVQLIPFTGEEAMETARISAELKKEGRLIGAHDFMIAGTALHHRLILVTSDQSDFGRIQSLQLEDWRQ